MIEEIPDMWNVLVGVSLVYELVLSSSCSFPLCVCVCVCVLHEIILFEAYTPISTCLKRLCPAK